MPLLPWSGSRTARRILFYAESPVKYAMFRPLHERLLGDPRVGLFFAGKLRGSGSSRRMARDLGIRNMRVIRRGLAALRRFDLLITADYDTWEPFADPRFPISATPRVQLFHGASVRNGSMQSKITRFQHLLTCGPYIERLFVKSGMFRADDPRLLPVGMPKTDRLLDGSLDRLALAASFGIDPALPNVTLAPTWVLRNPMGRYGVELIRALARGPWNLLVKLHDKFFDPRYNTVDWGRRLGQLERQLPRLRVVRDFDATPTLFLTDVLISDLSSIATEFSLLDRPIVYLAIEDLESLLRQYPSLDLKTWGQRAGEVVAEADACVAAVERALAEPLRNGEIRRAMAADFFHNPGRATDAALGHIYPLLALDPPHATPQNVGVGV